jgi:hypothetical protein
LYREHQCASLELWGIPIGGKLSGTAWFQEDGKNVNLDPNLHREVARRMVQVKEARHNTKDDTIEILVRLPVFGAKTMVLQRMR